MGYRYDRSLLDRHRAFLEEIHEHVYKNEEVLRVPDEFLGYSDPSFHVNNLLKNAQHFSEFGFAHLRDAVRTGSYGGEFVVYPKGLRPDRMRSSDGVHVTGSAIEYILGLERRHEHTITIRGNVRAVEIFLESQGWSYETTGNTIRFWPKLSPEERARAQEVAASMAGEEEDSASPDPFSLLDAERAGGKSEE